MYGYSFYFILFYFSVANLGLGIFGGERGMGWVGCELWIIVDWILDIGYYTAAFLHDKGGRGKERRAG